MNKFQTIIFASAQGRGGPPSTTAGPYKIATELRNAGISCQIIHHLHIFSYSELGIILDKLMDNQTILIGFSTVFWSHFLVKERNDLKNKTNYIVNYVLSKYPNCKIIGGGGSAGLLVNFKFQKLDALFEGYPEEILIEYIQNLKNKTPIPLPDDTILGLNNSVTNIYKQRNNINLNFQNSKIIYAPEDYVRSNDTAVIEIGRGCIFKCKFCAFPLNGKKNFDYIKTAQCIQEELIDNYEKYQIQNYIISDDTFNDSMYKLDLLYNMIIKLPFKIKFCCYLRLDLLNSHREQIDMLQEMGLAGTFFGVETFYKKSASLIGKGLDPDKAKQLLHDLKHTHWKNDVKVAVGLITGLPHETYESYEETKKWILSEENLIEQIRANALFIPNPVSAHSDPNISLFQQESQKYGFYWTNVGHNWKNINGPIKSYQEAEAIAKDLNLAIQSSCRELQGGFNIFQTWRSSPIIDPSQSFNDLLKMDRFQYSTWWKNTYTRSNVDKIYQHYKENFL